MMPNKTALDQLLRLLDVHPKRAALIKVGKSRDQLARALVPLLLLKDSPIPFEVSSVTMERFWKLHGNKIQASRIAKALREHVGYARNTKTGKTITPNGEKYLTALFLSKK